MPYSKVILDNETLINLTQDTVTEENVQSGFTVHKNNGSVITGTHREAEDNDVIFINYLGQIEYSYTAEEFLELETLPTQWDLPGMEPHGWNWSLTNAKAYVAEYGKLVIGALCGTADQRTKLYMHIDNDATLSILFNIWTTENNVSIDWGDGSAPEVPDTEGAHELSHTYAAYGDYIISIEFLDEDGYYSLGYWGDGYENKGIGLFGDTTDWDLQPARNSLVKVELSVDHEYFAPHCFSKCFNLETINTPFYNYETKNFIFSECNALVAYIFGGYEVTRTNHCMFQYCYNMRHVSYGQYTVTHSSGANVFRFCFALRKVTITGYQGTGYTATLIYGHFQECRSLETVILPKLFTSLSNSDFQYCYNLKELDLSNITSYAANSLQEIGRIPTFRFSPSVQTIPSSLLHSSRGVFYLYLPNTVNTINSKAFYNLYSLQEMHIDAAQPPTISNADALEGINSTCKIYVPASAVNAYKTATNWSTHADKILAEPTPAQEPVWTNYIGIGSGINRTDPPQDYAGPWESTSYRFYGNRVNTLGGYKAFASNNKVYTTFYPIPLPANTNTITISFPQGFTDYIVILFNSLVPHDYTAASGAGAVPSAKVVYSTDAQYHPASPVSIDVSGVTGADSFIIALQAGGSTPVGEITEDPVVTFR